MGEKEKGYYKQMLLLAVLVNLTAFFSDILGTDGTLYAVIAKQMAVSGNYLDLFVHGNDWLDKPHFPFWLTAFSFKVFGVNTFAYKFPALLFSFAAAYYTYRFALKLYSEEVANIAAVILLTAQHFAMSNNDVRAEPYLTGLLIMSVYYLYEACYSGKISHLIWGSLWAACAVMTKGIFVLIIIGGAIGGGLIVRGQWKNAFHWRWLAAALLILLFITPELYSLYSQFDLHPEKNVFGKNGVSGLRFFFWDSQFGRFTNQGPIKGSGSPLFFTHTLLWAFLPWCLFFYTSLLKKVAALLNTRQESEWFNFCGGVLGLLLFSLSSFQLPHYTNILFPFFAILTAVYLQKADWNKMPGRILLYIHRMVVPLTMALPFIILYFVWPVGLSTGRLFLWVIFTFAAWVWVWKSSSSENSVLSAGVLAFATINIFINIVFYPFIMKYQSGGEAAAWVNEHYPDARLTHYNSGAESYAFEFYAKQPVLLFKDVEGVDPFFVYTASDQVDSLTAEGYEAEVIKAFPHFHVSKLTSKFLNGNTRETVLKEYVLLKVVGPDR